MLNRLPAARKLAGLSRAQSARLLGVDRNQIDHHEALTDASTLPDSTLSRYSDLYRVTVSWIIGTSLPLPDDHPGWSKIRDSELTWSEKRALREILESIYSPTYTTRPISDESLKWNDPEYRKKYIGL